MIKKANLLEGSPFYYYIKLLQTVTFHVYTKGMLSVQLYKEAL